jgi:hypothetical protein
MSGSAPHSPENAAQLKHGLSVSVQDIAKVCHEINRTYCVANGDDSQLAWEQAPQWQRDSAVNGVLFHLENPEATPAMSHENWLREKVAAGWVFGLTKDPVAKTHPCCVPYERLPRSQQVKDHLFRVTVHLLAALP